MQLTLPVIIIKGIVLLPNNEIRIDLNNEMKFIIDKAIKFHNNKILIVFDINENKNLSYFGVVCEIEHKLELPNNQIRIILNGLKRANILEYLIDDEALIETIEIENNNQNYIKKLQKELKEFTKTIPYVSNGILSLININDLNKITDLIVPYLQINLERTNEYLYETNPEKRAEMILEDIYIEKQKFEIEKEIDEKVRKNLDEAQKEFILREKIKVIKEELNEKSIKENDLDSLREKLRNLEASNKIKAKIELEIKRYESLQPTSPEVSITRNYIEWLLDLPWNKHTIDNDDLIDVRNILDKSHNGLENVKTRIIEYLAVKQVTNSLRAPIICLVGPPGVGKTSLAKGIADAMHRKFVKMSVGGVNDEAELIGHRKTYIGASPGRIISSIKKAKSSNPVFLIDEIDKMVKNFKGDPASVLLEILDPEQNKYFSDNYIEEEYDLSKVMFIATANYIEGIPEALKDRLEIVELSGYTEYEKLEIARTHLLPNICKEHGLNYNSVIIKDEVILKIIRNYTKEAGVRELNRILSQIIRKIVTALATTKIKSNKFIIDNKKIVEYIGKPKYMFNSKNKKSKIGVVNALAYTPFGGDILPIEVNYFKGKGNLILTGSIGDVMKESATVALNYIKSNYKKYKINYDDLLNNDIHIHIPDTAVSKDGPSAGVTLTTALISSFAKLKIDCSIAMTGEITLRGEVLPIGGLKEKVIAASRNNIKKIIIPYDNSKDLEEIPEEIKENIEFILVKNYNEIYKIVGDINE